MAKIRVAEPAGARAGKTAELAGRVAIEGRGEPLVLLHGAGGPRVWDYLLAELYEHFLVIVPTLPGFRSEDGRIDYADRLYVDFLEEVRVYAGVDRWSVAGLSLGARAAVDYALTYRDRVSHLVVIDGVGMSLTRPFFSLPVVRDLVGLLINLAFTRPEVWTKTLSREVIDTKGPAAAWAISFVQDIVADPAVRRNVARMLPRVLSPKREWPRLLPSFTTPTLVLWGSDDPTTPVDGAYRLASFLPNCRLSVLEGYRHSGILEHPGFFAREMIDFLTHPAVKARLQ